MEWVLLKAIVRAITGKSFVRKLVSWSSASLSTSSTFSFEWVFSLGPILYNFAELLDSGRNEKGCERLLGISDYDNGIINYRVY